MIFVDILQMDINSHYTSPHTATEPELEIISSEVLEEINTSEFIDRTRLSGGQHFDFDCTSVIHAAVNERANTRREGVILMK